MRRENPGVVIWIKEGELQDRGPLNMNFDVEIINLKTVVDDNSLKTADPRCLPRVQHEYNIIIFLPETRPH